MDSALTDHIFNSFTPATKDEWQKAAKLELNGVDPFEKLSLEKGKIKILPYYDRHDVVSKENFPLKASTNEFLGPRAWCNMPTTEVKNVFDSNQTALSDLNLGADGVFFNIQIATPDLSTLLKAIDWPHCAISFAGDISKPLLREIHALAIEKKYNAAALTGCVFGTSPFENEIKTISLFENWDKFHPLGIEVEPNEVPAEEIAAAMVHSVRQIDFLTDKGLSPKVALRSLAFQINIDADFFLNVAKLKVIRILWHTISKSFNAQSETPIFIHACSQAWTKNEYQPNGNMLKSTTAALSAILGGCDALTILPEDNNNSTMASVARNVSSILREEAQLSKVADPTAGSYYLESLVDQLSIQAWETFQKHVNR